MNTLPALTALATAAIRRQFDATAALQTPPAHRPSAWRLRLATELERAARAVAPTEARPAH